MHDARAVVQAHVVGGDEATLELREDGLLVGVLGKLGARGVPGLAVGAQGHLAVPAGNLADALLQGVGHDLGAAVVDHGDVVKVRAQDDAGVGRHGPGRGGPDDHVGLAGVVLQARRSAGQDEAHVDGGADLVAVLDLRLGQGRVAVGAPVHRLAAAVDGTVVKDGLENLNVGGVVVVDVGQVGVVPLGQDAQALEALALGVDLLDGHLAAELANLLGGELVELLGAEHLLDLVLDGLAVAVPAGHVGRLVALHGPEAVDDVLGDLVLRVAEVDGAVGVRGAVVQDELVVALVLLEELGVDVVVVPLLEPLGLVLSQARAHREARLRQVSGLLVLVCHLCDPFLGTKKAPVPSCWDEALTSHFACYHPASGITA